jgi:membrane fusion protein (multidrug efflux system)
MKKLLCLILSLICYQLSAHTVIGVLQGKKEIIIKTKSQGQLEEIYFTEGEVVKLGDVLGSLNNEKESIEKEMAFNDFKMAEKEFNKSEKLAKYISKDELQQKESDFLKKKNLHKVKEYNLNAKNIRSPINGIFTRRFIKEGENISSGVKAFEVIQFDHLIIDLHVQAKYLSKIQKGNKMTFSHELNPTKKYLGEVYFIGPVLDKASGTINVKLRLANIKNKNGNYKLKPGAMVKVDIK